MKTELEKALANKYSFMKRKITLKEQAAEGYIDDLYGAFGCSCGDGWYDLLDAICSKIQAAYDEHGVDPDIVIDQIKEKWGTLRYYYHFGDDDPGIHAFDCVGGESIRFRPRKEGNTIQEKIAEIVAWGESKSAEICEECGKPGRRRDNRMYILTLCDDCDAKIED